MFNIYSTSIHLFFSRNSEINDVYLHVIYAPIILSCIIRKVIGLVFRLMVGYSVVYLTKNEAAIHE